MSISSVIVSGREKIRMARFALTNDRLRGTSILPTLQYLQKHLHQTEHAYDFVTYNDSPGRISDDIALNFHHQDTLGYINFIYLFDSALVFKYATFVTAIYV